MFFVVFVVNVAIQALAQNRTIIKVGFPVGTVINRAKYPNTGFLMDKVVSGALLYAVDIINNDTMLLPDHEVGYDYAIPAAVCK